MDFVRIFGEMISVSGSFSLPLYAVVLIPLFIYLIFFLLEGAGLYTMAKKSRSGIKWMAFVPFLNTFLIGKLAGESAVFGKKKRNLAAYVLAAELLAFAVGLAYQILQLLIIDTSMLDAYKTAQVVSLYGMQFETFILGGWVYVADLVLSLVNYLFYFLYLFIFMYELTLFFKRYSARNFRALSLGSLAGCIFCIPLSAIFIFAVRNNVPVNYEEFLRRSKEEYIRRRNAGSHDYYNNYNNTGNNAGNNATSGYNFDPYTGEPINKNSPAEEPFSEFSPLGGGKDNNGGGNNGGNDDSLFSS